MSLENFVKPKQPELAKHDSSVLDLAFVMDCTGSMGTYIRNATQSIREIVEEIVSLEKSDVKLALVEYRDHPPEDSTFVTRSHDFTESVKEMKKWLEACSALGGGDHPEAVADGLHDALKLSWRNNATKICILISDAPPHGLSQSGDKFPNGCPLGIDPLVVVNQMAEKGITLYSVGCEPSITPHKEFFTAIAFSTGGQYVPLRNANLLSKVIVGGAVEEISLEKLMQDVEKEVRLQQEQGICDEKELASAIESNFRSKGIKTKQMQMNNAKLEKASEKAIQYSKFSSLLEMKKEYKEETRQNEFAEKSKKSGGIFGFLRKKKPMDAPLAKSERTYSTDLADLDVLKASSASSDFSSKEDSYGVVEEEIQAEQVERLVQKAMKRNIKK